MAISTNKNFSENPFLAAKDSRDFLNAFNLIDISVPKKIRERKNEHRELYALRILMLLLNQKNKIKFPISIYKNESPDFLVRSGIESIGIEVIEATSSSLSKYKDLIDLERPGHFIEPSHFRFGRNYSKEELRKLLLRDKLTGAPWGGDEGEREWLLFVQDAINKKNKIKIQKFQKNWLLVYENAPLPPLYGELLESHITKLQSEISFDFFDLVFVLTKWSQEEAYSSDDWLICFSSDGVEYFKVDGI